MKTLNFLSFLLITIFASCSKDKTAPEIIITSPAEGATLEKGKTYPVQGSVTDDTGLSEIDAGGIKITTFDSKTSHKFANMNLPIPSTATTGSGTFTVTATDTEGNKGSKVVTFKIQ
jgi:hypothetical protein